MYSNEVHDIIITVMIVIILWLWNIKWWVSELKGGGVSRYPGPPGPPPTPGSAPACMLKIRSIGETVQKLSLG